MPTTLHRIVVPAALLLALAPPAALAQECGWSQMNLPTPPARHSAPLVYDSARDVIVMFGGLNTDAKGRGDPFGDTWEYDGNEWRQVATTGPSPRIGHAMVYDPVRGVTLLFGGSGLDGYKNDTWQWDGAAWRLVAATGPRPRGRHAMAFDSDRGVAILFGGAPRGGDETWEWNGVEWTQRLVAGPSERTRLALAYDSARRKTVLFGGRNPDGSALGDTWEWNGEQWTLVAETGATPRSRAVMVYDPLRGVCRLFGGTAGPYRRDTWEWNGAAWQLVADGGPPARVYAGMAQHLRLNQTILFGGWSGSAPLEDMWAWDCAGGIALAVDATCPTGGPIEIAWHGATPDGQVALIYAARPGSFIIPPQYSCAGTPLGLSSSRIQVVFQGSAGENGSRTLNADAGPGACGGYLQLLDVATCGTSNVVQVQ